MTLNDVGAVLLELRASYSAKEIEITRPVKTCRPYALYPIQIKFK